MTCSNFDYNKKCGTGNRAVTKTRKTWLNAMIGCICVAVFIISRTKVKVSFLLENRGLFKPSKDSLIVKECEF